MLYELFRQIRQALAGEFGLEFDEYGTLFAGDGADVRDIQWYAKQYEGVIHAVPALLIEVGKLEFTALTKTRQSTPVRMTVHVVTDIESESDGNTPDTAIREHEAIAVRAKEALEGITLDFDGERTRPVRVTGWEFIPRYEGWMVTLIDLETKA